MSNQEVTGLNMVATKKDAKLRTILALASNGSNVLAWKSAFQAYLPIEVRSHFLLPEFSIPVSAHLTLAIGVDVEVGRVIKERRAEYAAQGALDKGLRLEGEPVSVTTHRVGVMASGDKECRAEFAAQKLLNKGLRLEGEGPVSVTTPKWG